MGPDPTLHPEALGRRILPPGSPELRALVRRRPLRVWADTLGCYAVLIAAFILLAMHPTWWSYALVFLVVGNRQYALSILTHDGDHRTLFDKRGANDWFAEILLCPPVGVDFPGEKQNHGNHHRHFPTPNDPDRYLYLAADKATRGQLFLFLTGLTMFPRALRKALRGSPNPVREPHPVRRFLRRRAITLIVQALIFGAMWMVFPWYYYFVFWVGPIYPLVFVPHKVRMFCEHAQAQIPDEAADGRRLITYMPGPVERLLFSPFNLNHHVEHHLWPFVPYYNLPALHRLVAGRPEVEVRRSYLGFIRGFLRRLPLVDAPPPA